MTLKPLLARRGEIRILQPAGVAPFWSRHFEGVYVEFPFWIPESVIQIANHMRRDNSLSDRSMAFFTNEKLSNFWKAFGDYSNNYPNENIPPLFVGSFLAPLAAGYGETGSVDSPSFKSKTRAAQIETDKLIEKAATVSAELIGILNDIEKISSIIPEELRFLTVAKKLLPLEAGSIPTYYQGVRTTRALELLMDSLESWPKTSELFKDLPGMSSQKSTWRDFLREARDNLHEMADVYADGDCFDMRESYWVIIINILIDENISRESVQSALRT